MIFNNKYTRKLRMIIPLTLLIVCIFYLHKHSNNSPNANQIEHLFKPTVMTVNPCACEKNVKFQTWNGNLNILSTCSDERSTFRLNQSVISYSFYLPNEKWTKFEAKRKKLTRKGNKKVSSKLFKDEYTNGILANLKGMRNYFPGWVMRLYTNDESLCDIICKNDDLFWCDIRAVPGGFSMCKYYGRTWRFAAMGDPTVDIFSMRDLDSELSYREAAAIQDWLAKGRPFNLFRDHPRGHNIPILAGLWGGRNSLIGYNLAKDLEQQLFNNAIEQVDTHWALDQTILAELLYLPRPTSFVAYDSYNCIKWNESGNVRPFPTQREGKAFLGSPVLWKNIDKPVACPVECRPSYGKNWIYC